MPNYGAPVTDKKLLAQLNGQVSSTMPSYGAPVTDPNLLSQLNDQSSQSMPWNMQRISSDLTKGFLDLGSGLLNAPYNITNAFSPRAAQALDAAMPQILKHQPLPDEFQINPATRTWVDKMISGIPQYAPYAMGGELLAGGAPGLAARLGGQVGGGLAFGATQSENPALGAAAGAVTAPLMDLGMTGIGNVLAKALKIGQNTVTPAAKMVMDQFVNNKTGLVQQGLQKAIQNYGQNYKGKVDQIWPAAEQVATHEDAMPHVYYDDQPRIDALNKQIADFKSNVGRTPSAENDAAINLLETWRDTPVNSFRDAVDQGRAINNAYGKEIKTSNKDGAGTAIVPDHVIEHAQNNFYDHVREQMDQNKIGDLDPNNTFGRLWQAAREATQDQKETFHEIQGDKGGFGESSFGNFLRNNKKKFFDPSKFGKEYLPSNGNEGTESMQQFAQMVGDDSLAKGVLQHHLFGDLTDPKKIFDEYKGMTEQQKNYLLSPQQRTTLEGYMNLSAQHPKIAQNKGATNMAAAIYNALNLVGKGITALPGVKGAILSKYAGFPSTAGRVIRAGSNAIATPAAVQDAHLPISFVNENK